MVEGTTLEMWRTGNCTVGSNPTLSAEFYTGFMRILYRIGAGAIFLSHFALGIFFLTAWMFPTIRWFYLPLLVSWPACWIFLGYCPLTRAEFELRRKTGASVGAKEEFIQHYVKRFFGITLPPKSAFSWGLAVFALLFALSIATAIPR